MIKDEETHLPLPLPENPDTLASGRMNYQQHNSSTYSSAANQNTRLTNSRGLSKFLSHSDTNNQIELEREQEQRSDQITKDHFKLTTSFQINKAPSIVTNYVDLMEDEKEE